MSQYEITTDPSRIDIDAVYAFLSQSYWSPGIPRAVLERAFANSICFSMFCDGKQVGFARVITDRATFGYLADVYILEQHRGQGLADRLMHEIERHPDLQGFRRFMLATRDAHGLYAKHGFKPLSAPDRLMEILRPDVYRTES